MIPTTFQSIGNPHLLAPLLRLIPPSYLIANWTALRAMSMFKKKALKPPSKCSRCKVRGAFLFLTSC